MIGPRILRWMLALALAIAASTGCDDAESVPPPASHDLSEPWQAQPFAIDPAVIAEAERVCRAPAFGMLPQGGMPLVVADARGDGVLFLLFAAASSDAQCFLERDANGRFINQGGGGGSSSEPRRALPPNGIELGGTGSQGGGIGDQPGPKGYTSGRAGIGIAALEVVLANNQSIQASLNGGWYAAWWRTDQGVRIIRGYDGAGTLVGSSQ